jgi:hypothetical protein
MSDGWKLFDIEETDIPVDSVKEQVCFDSNDNAFFPEEDTDEFLDKYYSRA